MPGKIEIDGVGVVEVDDSFFSATPEVQEATVAEIASSMRQPSRPPGAPLSPRRQQPITKAGPSTVSFLKETLGTLPGIKFTSADRTADHQLDLKRRGYPAASPENSYHVGPEAGVGYAVDFVAPNASKEQIAALFEAKGVTPDQIVHHPENGSWHVALNGTNLPPSYAATPTDEASGDSPILEVNVTGGRNPTPEEVERDPSLSGWRSPTVAAQGLKHGFEEIMGLPVDLATGAINSVLPEKYEIRKPVGGSEFFKDTNLIPDVMGIEQVNPEDLEGGERYLYEGARLAGGNVAPGLGMIGAGIKAGNAVRQTTAARAAMAKLAEEAAKRPVLTMATELAAGAGSGVGGQAADDLGAPRIVGETIGALAGGATTAGVPLLRTASDARFVANQAKDPRAPFFAEIVEDLTNIVSNRGPGEHKVVPKGRADVTVTQVNSLERSYITGFKEKIKALDMPQVEKRKLIDAIEEKHAITPDRLEVLRGTVAGNAVADSITKIQALRDLTPEIKRGGPLATLQGLSEAAGAVGGASAGGPLAAPAGMGLVRLLFRRGSDAEAARVHSAERAITRGRAYKKLQEKVGPSGQRESQSALNKAYEDAITAKEAEEAATSAEKASKPSKDDLRSFRADIAGAEPDARDAVSSLARRALKKVNAAVDKAPDALHKFDDRLNQPKPEATIGRADRRNLRAQLQSDEALDPRDTKVPETDAKLAQRVSARDRAIAKLEGNIASFDRNLEAPKPAAKTPKLSAAEKVIQDQISRGVKGTGGTLSGFANAIGAAPEDVSRALQQLPESFAELAPEVTKLGMNYPIKRDSWTVLKNEVSRILNEDGSIERHAKAKSSETAKVEARKSEAATSAKAKKQAKTSPVETAMAPEAPPPQTYDGPETPPLAAEMAAREGEGKSDFKPIGRPKQWEQGKQRIIAAQREVADRMYADGRMSKELLSAVHGPIERIITKQRTVEDAMRFFDEDVYPDLRADGFTDKEIQLARSHAYGIAAQKRYETSADFDENVKRRARGRPKKND